MTDREKLTDIVVRTPCVAVSSRTAGEHIADHLIANGVVVQRWIPVTERLPEKGGQYLVFRQYFGSGGRDVICFTKDGRKVDDYDFRERWENVWYDYDSEYGYCVTDSVTHWMPLPEPPKDGDNE